MKEAAVFFLDWSVLFLLNYVLSNALAAAIVFSFICCVFLFAFRLYEDQHLTNLAQQFIRTLVALTFSIFASYVLYPLLHEVIGLRQFAINVLLGSAVISVVNYSVGVFFTKRVKPKRCLVIGKAEIEPVLQEIMKKSNGRFVFVERINPDPASLKQKAVQVDALVVADYDLFQHVRSQLEGKYPVLLLSELAERILKRIPLEVMDSFKNYYEMLFIHAEESSLKRALDIVCALIGLIVFSPLMLVTALCIYIEDGRPVIFKQERVGKDGVPFIMYKFRTMKNEKRHQAMFVDQETHRILKIGKLIRPIRLDETLQFVNILKGDMSIVGPRPEQVPFVRDFEQKIPFYSYRHKLKPGLTGWAQIMYKYSSNLEEVKTKLSYDLYYIKNRTIFMDIRIILQTIEAVFWKRGAK
ncbi:polyprenyl glycosylphosphotransferase [Thermotoga sp. Ku-13t]|uniref:sugar transferase n=1 Tax=Thermotoga sp. Ku-13t TaxID=1755813 RepID=UPI0013E9AE25|nr:sugar transferase [Thermotoga sp. Ku-13t]KAF2958589.1 polyprenyl glycosylphosphotransferase [Thermotoga sp. Ku-13t]